MKTGEKQLKEFVDEAVQEYNSCLRPGENRVRLRLTNREVLVMDTAVNRFIASQPKDQPTELIKTVNPVGFLKNGKYFSFEQMRGETNDDSDIIQPLYSMALYVKEDQPKGGESETVEEASLSAFTKLLDEQPELVKKCLKEIHDKYGDQIFEEVSLSSSRGGEMPTKDEIKKVRELFDKYYDYVRTEDDAEQRGEWRQTFCYKVIELIRSTPSSKSLEEPKAESKFEICLWVHTDIDEPDTTFTMVGKSKEEVQKDIDYINKNCLKSDRRLEIMEEVKS